MSDLGAVRAEVLARHQEHQFYRQGRPEKGTKCWTDQQPWPCDAARLALAIEAEAADREGLDVERLARAMARANEGGNGVHTKEQAEDHWPSYLSDARRYVAEYAEAEG